MKVELLYKHIFSHQPLAALGKLSVIALFGDAALCGLLTNFVGLVDNFVLLILAGSLLLSAGLVATGVRWTPIFGCLSSGTLLFVFLLVFPFAINHLTHPHVNFTLFVVIVLLLASLIVALGASIGATVQNSHQTVRPTPHWLTPVLKGFAVIMFGIILASAILPTGTASTATYKGPTVHLRSDGFIRTTVSIPKGSKLLLVDDGSFLHILSNGSWKNGVPTPENLPGAPVVSNVQFNGNSVEIGPFTIAGIYHLYCSVHPGMTLAIIVQ